MSDALKTQQVKKVKVDRGPKGGGATWAGMILPGLGHLATGRWVDGTGMLMLSGTLVWAAVSTPNIMVRLSSPGTPTFSLHAWIAVVGFIIAVGLTWFRAFRFASPRKPRPGDEIATWWDETAKQFVKNRIAVLGTYSVLTLMLLAVLTPFIAPFDPDAIDVGEKLAAPSWGYLMGTDEFRRDIFSRVMYGARISLSIGFVAVFLAGSIGTIIGAIAGFFGGVVDKALMWFTDLLLSLPRLVFLLAIIGFYRAAGAESIFLIVAVLGITGWMGIARIVRSQVLSLKEQEFVQAGRALGLSDARLIARHIIPNTLAPVIVYGSLAIGSTILVEASLSFLGLGVPPPTATWGSIVNDGREYLRSAWWITLFPGLLIVAAVMSFNLLGDGLRDALDPKLRGRE